MWTCFAFVGACRVPLGGDGWAHHHDVGSCMIRVAAVPGKTL